MALAPFVPSMPIPGNVPAPFRLSQIPSMMWNGFQNATADWKKSKEMDMKLREAMISRILGGGQLDGVQMSPMAQQKASLAPEQFRLDTPAPIQKSTYLRPPSPEVAPMAPAGPAPTIHPFRGAGSVLPSGQGDMAGREFFKPMY